MGKHLACGSGLSDRLNSNDVWHSLSGCKQDGYSTYVLDTFPRRMAGQLRHFLAAARRQFAGRYERGVVPISGKSGERY